MPDNSHEQLIEKVKTELDKKNTRQNIHNVVYGAVSEDGTVDRRAYACHAFMKDFTRAKIIYSAFMEPYKQPASDVKYQVTETERRNFFNWITSPEGPWRSFYALSPEYLSKADYTSLEFAYNKGFVWDELDKHPSNLQQSFLIATRNHRQYGDMIKWWNEFVAAGAHPAVAYFFVGMVQPSYKSYTKRDLSYFAFRSGNKGEWPLYSFTCGMEYFDNFCKGRVEALNVPYSKSTVYTPVARIFGKVEHLGNKTYYRYLLDTYKKDYFAFTREELIDKGLISLLQRNSFPENLWFISKEQLLKVMKLEEERIFKTNVNAIVPVTSYMSSGFEPPVTIGTTHEQPKRRRISKKLRS